MRFYWTFYYSIKFRSVLSAEAAAIYDYYGTFRIIRMKKIRKFFLSYFFQKPFFV